MSFAFTQRGMRLLERYYVTMRNNPVALSLSAYLILLALYASTFYIFAIQAPLHSIEKLAVDTRESEINTMISPSLRSEQPAASDPNVTKDSAKGTSMSNSVNYSERDIDGSRSQNLTVNGHSVKVPKNGSSHTIIHNTTGSGDVGVSITSRSSGSTDMFSSMEVNVESSNQITKDAE